MNELMQIAAENFADGRSWQMTGKDLELARAWFAEKRNSRRVAQINEVLRARLAARLQEN